MSVTTFYSSQFLNLQAIATHGLGHTSYAEFLNLSSHPSPWSQQDSNRHCISILRIIIFRQLLSIDIARTEIQQLLNQVSYMQPDDAFMLHCEAIRIHLISNTEIQAVEHIISAQKIINQVDPILKDYWHIIMSLVDGYLLHDKNQLSEIQQIKQVSQNHHPYSIAWNSIVYQANLSWAYFLNGKHEQAWHLNQQAIKNALSDHYSSHYWQQLEVEGMYIQTRIDLPVSSAVFSAIKSNSSSQTTPLSILLLTTEGLISEKQKNYEQAHSSFQEALAISRDFQYSGRYTLIAYHHALQFYKKQQGVIELIPLLEHFITLLEQMRNKASFIINKLQRHPYDLRYLKDTLASVQIVDFLSSVDPDMVSDPSSRGHHNNRVGDLSYALAVILKAPNPTAIGQAARLHDLGKVRVSDSILLKRGPLDTQEREYMQKHTIEGAKMLSTGTTPLVQMARIIARSHHERWDGTGYPDGLSGTEIPLEARITSVADVFDALTSQRVYKRAWSTKEAHDEIRKLAGHHFDPQVVQALDELLSKTVPQTLSAGGC